MAAEPQHPLSDLRDQSKRVLTFTTNVTRESFGNDILRVYAVERCFEIIGEAMRRLERIDPSLAQRFERWQEVIAFRNLLAHSYYRVELDVVWSIIEDDVPKLLETAEHLLDKSGRLDDN